MIVVGERINSTRKRIAEAIKNKDKAFLQDEARIQAGVCAYIDVNCAMSLDKEPEDMAWLVTIVQQAVDLPLCIDSPNPRAIEAGLKVHKGEALVNSITAEESRIQEILPLVKKYNCRVVALTMDEKGMPANASERVAIAAKIMERVNSFGIEKNKVFFDPLVRPISTEPGQAREVLSTIKAIKQLGLSTICGVSNVSFGLPRRSCLNAGMLTLAIYAGLDAAIIDPLDKNTMLSILATEAVLGRDEYCLNFIQAFRSETSSV